MNLGQKKPFVDSLGRAINTAIAEAFQLEGKSLPCSVVAVNGAIITVKFEVNSDYTLPQVDVPLLCSEYIRYPIKAGDKGFCIAADALLGGMSGLGGGTPDLRPPSNLGALVFFPIGSTDWASVDPDAVTIYAPNGAVIRDTGSNSVITLLPASINISGQDFVRMISGTSSFTVNSDGTFSIIGTSNGIIQASTLTINASAIAMNSTGAVNVGGNGTTKISDATYAITMTQMHNVWLNLLNWLNTHTHSNGNGGGNTGSATSPAPSDNIAPPK